MAKVLARNRKARFEYEILEKLEAGLVLKGWQVKSIKAGKASLPEAYVFFRGEEAYLTGMHIGDWPTMSDFDRIHKTDDIKLLMHKRELARWAGRVAAKGVTAVPLALFEERGLIKLEVGLGRGRDRYDKRKKIQEREGKREIQRQLKGEVSF